jgi:phosphoglycolate phosphatase-like HAD superfamily hydrolase
MTTCRLVLFDIDGTLLLTSGAGRRAITAALATEVGSAEAFDRIRFDGKTDPQIVAELLAASGDDRARDPEFIGLVCRRYIGLLAEELALPRSKATLMPGVATLLDRLEAQAGVILGLLTGNVAEGAALKLAAAGIAPERFLVGAYGSDSAHRPDLPAIAARRAWPLLGREPRGHEVVIIGDTPADVECGRPIEARAIAVATGGYSLDLLAAAGAHATFADLSETEQVLEAILGD